MLSLCHYVLVENNSSLFENAVPMIALIVSLIALFISIWSTRIQRKHNMKSVRPVGHVQLHDSLQGIQVRIVNKGCGPMLVKEFIAVLNGKEEHNLVYHLPDNILAGFTHRTHTEPEGYWLTPSDELILLNLKGNHEDPNFVIIRENVRSILGEIVINLTFSDIYDERHPVFTKSLSWFKRDL